MCYYLCKVDGLSSIEMAADCSYNVNLKSSVMLTIVCNWSTHQHQLRVTVTYVIVFDRDHMDWSTWLPYHSDNGLFASAINCQRFPIKGLKLLWSIGWLNWRYWFFSINVYLVNFVINCMNCLLGCDTVRPKWNVTNRAALCMEDCRKYSDDRLNWDLRKVLSGYNIMACILVWCLLADCY